MSGQAMTLAQRVRLAMRILRAPTGNLMTHAITEMGPGCDIEIKEMVHVFSTQGHSGASAAITVDLLSKLLRYAPIGPLTGDPAEWFDHGGGMFQNTRCGAVFKQPDRFGGQAYYLDAIVWEDADGSRFANSESAQPITFPYTPTTVYRYRPCPEATP